MAAHAASTLTASVSGPRLATAIRRRSAGSAPARSAAAHHAASASSVGGGRGAPAIRMASMGVVMAFSRGAVSNRLPSSPASAACCSAATSAAAEPGTLMNDHTPPDGSDSASKVAMFCVGRR
jgi:hypothetical protein